MRIILAFIMATLLAFAFQNCGEVGLEKLPAVLPDSYLKAKASVCLAGAYQGYTLKAATATNLNILIKNSEPFIDSDVDGISDEDETKYGLNPLNRRSNGRILDKICFDLGAGADCDSLAQTCTGTPTGLGLTDCDVDALNLDTFSQITQGLDADKDGLIDLLEIVRGTVAGRSDALEDPDHDFVLNFEEIARGTNPQYHDSDTASRKMSSLEAKLNTAPEVPCSGESWDIKVDRVPMAFAPAYDGSGDSSLGLLDLQRAKDENTGLILLVLKPITGSGNLIYLYKQITLNNSIIEMSLTVDDFSKAGEVAP